MTDSVRHKALDNLVSALGNITVANGYVNTVTTVAMRAFEWETVWQEYALPVIGVLPLAARYEYLATQGRLALGGVIQATQEVAIEFGYQATSQELAWSTGDSLIDDIIGAIHVDVTRGGNALHTKLISAETDAGNPDIIDSRGGTAMGIIRVELPLIRGWSVS